MNDDSYKGPDRRKKQVLTEHDREWLSEVLDAIGGQMVDLKRQNETILRTLRGDGDVKGVVSRVDLLEDKVRQLWTVVFGLAGVLLTALFVSKFFGR